MCFIGQEFQIANHASYPNCAVIRQLYRLFTAHLPPRSRAMLMSEPNRSLGKLISHNEYCVGHLLTFKSVVSITSPPRRRPSSTLSRTTFSRSLLETLLIKPIRRTRQDAANASFHTFVKCARRGVRARKKSSEAAWRLSVAPVSTQRHIHSGHRCRIKQHHQIVKKKHIQIRCHVMFQRQLHTSSRTSFRLFDCLCLWSIYHP